MATSLDFKINAELPHQQPVLASKSRFKVLRCGRRWGKTRVADIAANLGHGAQPNGKGVLDGGDIIWVARDYPNAKVIWNEEIKPRFSRMMSRNRENSIVRLIEQEKRVEIKLGPDKRGSLEIWSADNITSARGGAVDGIICDESAHWDLRFALLNVLYPMLIDREGWLMLVSTPWYGSYFNEICQGIIDADPAYMGWYHHHGTGYDNPVIKRVEMDRLVAMYPPGSPELDQEVYAKLTVPGGLAFKEWSDEVHVHKWEPFHEWYWVAGIDWGRKQGHFGIGARGPDGQFYGRWEFAFSEMAPYEAGYQVGKSTERFPLPNLLVYDPQMHERPEHVSIIDKFIEGWAAATGRTPPAVPAPKGQGSRYTRRMLMHELLKWEQPEDGSEPKGWQLPKGRWHPDCEYTIRTIPRLPLDTNNPELVAKKGTADDHAFDTWTYVESYMTPKGERPQRGMPDRPGEMVANPRTKPWLKPRTRPEDARDGYVRHAHAMMDDDDFGDW